MATREQINSVYYAVEEALQVDWPANKRGMNSQLINYLLGRGYTEEEIVGCAEYMRAKNKGKVTGFDMRIIRSVIGEWITQGARKQPPNPSEVVQTTGDHGPPDWKAKRQKEVWE